MTEQDLEHIDRGSLPVDGFRLAMRAFGRDQDLFTLRANLQSEILMCGLTRAYLDIGREW